MAMVFLSMLPQLHLWVVRGRDWNGAYVSLQGDEPFYSAYLNALMDGRTRRNDPYAGKDSTVTSPLPESTFSIQLIPAYVISFLAKTCGISASTAFIVLLGVSGLLASLCVFWLLNSLVGDRRIAAAGTLFVLCMGEDQEDNVWVGTTRGLFQIRKRRVKTFTTADGLADDFVSSVCEGTQGEIWAGTDRGLSCIRDGRVVSLGTTEPHSELRDRCVWPDPNGGVWIVKENEGVYKFNQGGFHQVAGRSDPLGSLGALFTDRSGRLCIGAQNGVVLLQNGQLVPMEGTTVFAQFKTIAGLPGDPRQESKHAAVSPAASKQSQLRDVRAILQDREGNFWFGTEDYGLLRLRGGTLTQFTTRDGLSNDRVWSVHEDKQGTLWLGTENGLTRYREGKFFVFTSQHGLQADTINCILEDELGCFWLSGLKGIYRIKRAQLDDVAAGLSDLRAAVTNYHGAVLGHGIMLSELDERVRRIERHLKLESAGK